VPSTLSILKQHGRTAQRIGMAVSVGSRRAMDVLMTSEWREEHGKKQPYFFARKDGKPVMFAEKRYRR
jgi:hypothetical protein